MPVTALLVWHGSG